jgi:riboflavin kinase, archaea type
MRGKILSGLCQAQYFLTREGYSRQFLERLGFVPFPGTLNVRLVEPFPAERQAIKIEGFAEGSKSFGECECYRLKLKSIEAAVVRPEKSRYLPELIEVSRRAYCLFYVNII